MFGTDMGIRQVLKKGTDMTDEQVDKTLEMKEKAMEEGILDLGTIDDIDFYDQDFLTSMTQELNKQLQLQQEILAQADVEFHPEPIQVNGKGSLFTEQALDQVFSELPFHEALAFIGKKFGKEQTRGYTLIAQEMGLEEDEIQEILE